MQIETHTSHAGPARAGARRRLWIAVLASLAVAGAGFVLGVVAHRSGVVSRAWTTLPHSVQAARNFAAGLGERPQTIAIHMNFENYQRLAYQREQALARNLLVTDSDDYVSAVIQHDGRDIKAKVRLKGDLVDHLKTKKWSFRVKLSGESSLWGMRVFSLQSPETRNFIHEWLFHEAARREGLVALRYDFVRVILNGKDLGIYALEEHFEKRLIESNRRREGPILKLDESVWWAERAPFDYERDEGRRLPGWGSYHSQPVDLFRAARTLADPALRGQFERGAHLLEGFRRGEYSSSEVFDLDTTARWLALSDLFGSHHALHANQLRFYYNPVTSRLEPIGFDVNEGGEGSAPRLDRLAASYAAADDSPWQGGVRTLFLERLFEDRELLSRYLETLDRVSRREYLDGLLTAVDDDLARCTRLIHREFPNQRLNTATLFDNQTYIRSVLHPERAAVAYVARAANGDRLLQAGNLQGLDLELRGLSAGGREVPLPEPGVLPAKHPRRPVAFRELRLNAGDLPQPGEATPLLLRVGIVGMPHDLEVPVGEWSPLDASVLDGDPLRRPANAAEFEFVEIDSQSRSIRLRPGRWRLERDLILPAGFTVRGGAGVRIELGDSARIVSYSPLVLQGEPDSPVVFASPDGTGQGIVVLQAGGRSLLEHVVFDNLSNPAQGAWQLTSAVSFYESPVEIRNCTFARARSEDSLNIIRGPFRISGTLFADNLSDALDVDFGDGEIESTVFRNSGNDAVDVSGTTMRLRGVAVDVAGDKGISVGEGSHVEGTDISVAGVEIALASKDSSRLQLDGVIVKGSRVGMTVFQKKSEFGPATMTASEVELTEIEVPYLVEERSSLTVNGEAIPVSGDHLKDIFYGVRFGKASG